tara:strand:+ start:195 stop:872 length:678 start_codon:yes stop_codon:yes gene_type:complete
MKNEALKRILSSVIIIPLALFFIIKGSIFFIFFISVCFLIASYEWYMMSKNKPYNILGHLFLLISFYSAFLWREYISLNAESFLFIILICVFTDIGGYTFGKIFKGPKLTKISPNKTYSGMIGGYLIAFISVSAFIYSDFYFKSFGQLDIMLELYNIIFIFTVSTLCQLGDIIVSYFKRLSKIKDTGKLIPGHGGLLDRIDGMLFALPITYLIYYHESGFWYWPY